MSFRDLKVGDEVYLSPQRRCHIRGTKQIVRVGRKYAYIRQGQEEHPFCRDTGRSVHDVNHNARANGWGFDVYRSEGEYLSLEHDKAEFIRLRERLLDHSLRLVQLSPETVSAIHAILDAQEPTP